jgi:acyl-coenzyme A synthetase/AMP-(fatty) acid ligase
MTVTYGGFDYGVLRERWYSQGWYSSATCIDAFERGAIEHADVPVVFVAEGSETTATVSEIHCAAQSVAAGMQRLGIRPGDAVAVQLTNRLECAVAYQAVLLCGAVLVPVVHIYGHKEVQFILSASRARLLLMPATFRSTSYLQRRAGYSELPALDRVVVVGAAGPGNGYLTWPDLLDDADDYVVPTVCSDDVCVLLYTSGTVSVPKGVGYTNRRRPGSAIELA